ncbi:hypothetical protein ESCO_004054 [Escovopsis weberi]|uniref:Uncharacterized protein n=1 Tax=Escovopsis weberi TaxID=150374 RepID=A0A0M8N6T9_ESCWE|nr:hypothetical protein ESCO_004054 [Escovopsis weberi]
MSTSRAKRPFAGAAADPAQRQITSFFTKAPEGSASLSQPLPPPLQGPLLPAGVQADLLTVGMRIRKSVTEGYKTHGATSAFKLWTDTATSAADLSAATGAKQPLASHVVVAARATRPATRELLPFCGINKIGGLATQPEFDDDDDDYYYEDDDDDVPALDDVPAFTISQESADSYVCETSRKRGFDGDHGDGQDYEEVVWTADDEWAHLGDNVRVIALPRTRAKGGDQENMEVDDDFEEAGFLVFGEGSNQMDF